MSPGQQVQTGFVGLNRGRRPSSRLEVSEVLAGGLENRLACGGMHRIVLTPDWNRPHPRTSRLTKTPHARVSVEALAEITARVGLAWILKQTIQGCSGRIPYRFSSFQVSTLKAGPPEA